jgi:hypothetical protein
MRSLSSDLVTVVIGAPDGGAPASRRHTLEGPELAQARAWREAGRGWQTIARCLCVNEIDLRTAMGDLAREARGAAPEHERFAAPVKPLRSGTQLAAALLVIAAGERTPKGLAKAVGRCTERAYQLTRDLGDRGLITGSWALTPAGRGEVRRLKGAADA